MQRALRIQQSDGAAQHVDYRNPVKIAVFKRFKASTIRHDNQNRQFSGFEAII